MSKIEGLLQSMLIGFDKKVERLFINILQRFTREIDLKYKNHSQNENTTYNYIVFALEGIQIKIS